MTRQELDDRLLDYLYDELELSERTAFERALPAHPEVAKEVEAHRATRKAYQALLREVAPPGLLASVLAQADVDAAKRAEAGAAAEVPIGIWERLRIIVFQPAFAMAMVVMVVAGVSLVGRKGELGIEPALDSQHIPPVAVNDASDQGTVERLAVSQAPAGTLPQEWAAPSTATAPEALAKGEADADHGAQGAVGLDPATPPSPAYAREVKVVGEFDAPRAVSNGDLANKPATTSQIGPVVSPAAPAVSPAAEPGPRTADADMPRLGGLAAPKNELDQAGYGGADAKKTLGPGTPPAVVDGEVEDAIEKGDSKDYQVADDSVADRARNANTVDPAPRAPPEMPIQPAKNEPKRDAKPADVASERAQDKAKAPAAKPTEEVRAPEPKVATKDVESNRGGGEEPRKVETTEVKREARPATEESYATKPDVAGRRDTDTKPATLTPPAPTSDKLWSTYQQQTAAGAYADALRSIELLAKVEGESTRVKQARDEIKKKIEALAVQPAGTNKMPPDPPVQAPK